MMMTSICAWQPNTADTCDACGGVCKAYTRATNTVGMSLFFCAHHSNQLAARLIADGWQIEDHTEQLTKDLSV